MRFDTIKVCLPLKKKFVVSKGSAENKTNILTVMNNRYSGEASGSVHYGPSIEILEADIARGLEILRGEEKITPATLTVITHCNIHPTAKSALTAMVLNYLSGESDRYPWEIVGLGNPVGIRSSWTVGIDTPAEMLKAIRESEYPIVKVKMGTDDDAAILEGLHNIGSKQIRVDANGGWSCAKAEEMIYYLSKKGVTLIEQPTDIEFLDEWRHLKGRCEHVELFIDEGLCSLDDYERVAPMVDGVNIKMEKCGGIVAGAEIARKARKDQKKVMLGCMVESSVGIAQSVYMSSLADYYDLDGPLLLQDDIANGIRYDIESIAVDREIIGGPTLKRELVDKFVSS
jgi:L-Ala-D/L-Glu epimerase